MAKHDVDRIIFTRNMRHRINAAFHRRVEAVVILRLKAEDGKSTTDVALRFSLVRFAQEARNREFGP